MVIIVDYGLGNLQSVKKAFQRIDSVVQISSDLKQISEAKKLVLPGVGHFTKGMENLRNKSLVDILTERVIDKKIPILGICLGMQLMTEFSEEGNCDGLGWVKASTIKFNNENNLSNMKIPHMGWNTLTLSADSTLLSGINPAEQFYFVHSYKVHCKIPNDVISTTDYYGEFHSAFCHENIYGVQFHPEKSHSHGLQLLKNFATL